MAENIRALGRPEAIRPSISLPSHTTDETLFRLEPAEASPNPLNLVSSFFSDDPESDCRSFSQLLAGAVTFPAAGDVRGRGEQSRPMNLLAGQSPFFTSPTDLSPGGLLDFPAMFSSNLCFEGLGLRCLVLIQMVLLLVSSSSHQDV